MQTPQSQSEFEEQLRDIPGASVQPHTGDGVNVTLEDGTKITTYPERATDGQPSYTIRDPDGQVTHHGSLTGTD